MTKKETAPQIPDTPAQRVRERIAHWLEVTGLAQHEFATACGKTQVWLQHVLKGKNNVTLKDLDEVARAMRTTASELVRDGDQRYQLELTPTEVRLIEQLRRHPEMFAGVAILLHIPTPSLTLAGHDRVRPPRPKPEATTK